jgi:hypothetical protein
MEPQKKRPATVIRLQALFKKIILFQQGLFKNVFLSPGYRRLPAPGNAVVFKFGVTQHHGPESLVPFGQPQCLDHGRKSGGRHAQITGPAGSQPYGTGGQLR